VQGGVADLVRKQVALKNDLHSDGEFWKARDQMYYDSRTTGVEMQPVTADKPAWRLAHQPERRMPQIPPDLVVNPQSIDIAKVIL
jgi:hypothetical protein